ncbi:CP2 transcription factor-domain-containing protein [Pilobolus umbonatus]|nr:CP2 transcription factor-domain-containing protein [Pilobolus umbonatus]
MMSTLNNYSYIDILSTDLSPIKQAYSPSLSLDNWNPFSTNKLSDDRSTMNIYSEESINKEDSHRFHLRYFSATDRRTSNPYFQLNEFSYGNSHKISTLDNSQNILEYSKHQRDLNFNIILEAATAVTQKAEESAITYLNRGQGYFIQLNDKQMSNKEITSTLSIQFHTPSYRKKADDYWRFWIAQQKQEGARAIDIDANQSTGITDLEFPSFDKISFKWNGVYGAKIHIRFKCLSTDFSRIKGVKGIPLRAQVESEAQVDSLDQEETIKETCFCKVKLFRDKGAERKNKDDAKQIARQLEKIYGKSTEQSLGLMYNISLPYSIFSEIPISPIQEAYEHATEDLMTSSLLKTPARFHTRVMTAPDSMFCRENIPFPTLTPTEIGPYPVEIVSTASNFCSSTSVLKNGMTPTRELDNYFNPPSFLTPELDPVYIAAASKPFSMDFNQVYSNYSDTTTSTLDEDSPSLTEDSLFTQNTLLNPPLEFPYPTPLPLIYQPLPIDNHCVPDTCMRINDATPAIYDYPSISSLYGIFTPDETSMHSYTPNDYFLQSPHLNCTMNNQQDYFCKAESMTPDLTSSFLTDSNHIVTTDINVISNLPHKKQRKHKHKKDILSQNRTNKGGFKRTRY